jgi:DNA helicase TIP49 (TBP-interacting protein)
MEFPSIYLIGNLNIFHLYYNIFRLLIIRTSNYNLEDIIKILAIRANTENIKLSAEALSYLGTVGHECSLRFKFNEY